jgi:hypothetical protein
VTGVNTSADRATKLGVAVAASLAVATAVAQLVDYHFFDLRLKALDSNTHLSVFGVASLLANAVAVGLAISLAARGRNRELLLLSGALTAMLALRVTYPPGLLLLSLPLAGIALAILWRLGRPSAGDGSWTIRVGCSLLVVSFAIHAWELEPLPLLRSVLPSAHVSGGPVGGAVIGGRHHEVSDAGDLATGTWTHLALTYDGAALSFYVDGRPVSTTRRTGDIATSTDSLTIGSDPFYGQYFTGLIDEIRIYDTALSARQVRDDMTTPVDLIRDPESREAAIRPVPVAAFAFNEGSGAVVLDASGGGNDGTVAHATWTAAGKDGGALSFNGSSSRVTIPDSASLRLTGALTLEAWVNPTTVSNEWRDVIEKGNDDYYLSATSLAHPWASQLRSLAKHEAELLGWIMIATGLLGLRTSNAPRSRMSPRSGATRGHGAR